MCILMDWFVIYFYGKMLNIYFFLLFKYKGLNIYVRVIEVVEFEYGCSVYFVNNELDSGVVIGQFKVFL